MTPRTIHRSLVEVLVHRATEAPTSDAYIFVEDGDSIERRASFAEMDRRARAIAARLQASAPRGTRALLLYPPGLEYICAFFGCLYAGMVAVPAYPPDPARLGRTLPRLLGVIADARAEVMLTTSEINAVANFLFAEAPTLATKTWIATDVIDDGLASAWVDPGATSDGLAFLQYTSGSTGEPKGVQLTHGNLLHNMELISTAFEIDPETIGVSWLPPYHDMGLIGGILAPLYNGIPTALMSPIAFLQRPLRWLEAITRYRGTISGGPNFAFDLCVKKATPEAKAMLDLSSWRLAFTGAEPVRRDTLERFSDAFAECGFRKSAYYPCYGLAEATLIVSGGKRGAGASTLSVDATALERDRVQPVAAGGSRELVSCGRPLGGQDVSIVRPATGEAAGPGEVGEIWLSGPSVSNGYWGREELSSRTLRASLPGGAPGTFLRTGDLGFLHEGELFITGRLKDLIIVRGRNHYPQDIERTAEESHPSLRRGCCAAFSVEVDGEERLVVAVEVERRHHERRRSPSTRPRDAEQRTRSDRRTDVPEPIIGADAPTAFDPEAVYAAVRRAVTAGHDVRLHAVVLLKGGSIPKTSSGKVQRQECRSRYVAGSLEEVARQVAPPDSARRVDIAPASVESVDEVLSVRGADRVRWMTGFLTRGIAGLLNVPPDRIAPSEPISSLGLDSLMAVELAHDLEKASGTKVPMTAFLEDTSLDELARRLVSNLGASQPVAVRPALGPQITGFPLSQGQQSLWLIHQLAPDADPNHLAFAFRIRTPLDVPALRTAFARIVERHSSLRATVHASDPPSTRPLPPDSLSFETIDARDWTVAAVDAHLAEQTALPFSLDRGPLMRVQILRRQGGEHLLHVVVHHMTSDFWSFVIVLDELRSSYPALARGESPASSTPEYGYADFVQWQTDWLESPPGKAAASYWEGQLAGELPELELPIDRPRPPATSHRGGRKTIHLGRESTAAIKALALAQRTTVFTTLLAAFQTLLHRLSGQDDILVGSPVACRNAAALEGVVGYCMNPLIFRASFAGDPTFQDLVSRTRRATLDAFRHQEYPAHLLAGKVALARRGGRSQLFRAMFILNKPHLAHEESAAMLALGQPDVRLALGELELESVSLAPPPAQFDVTLMMAEAQQGLVGSLHYSADLFDEETIDAMVDQFLALLRDASLRPSTRVSRLALGTAKPTAAAIEVTAAETLGLHQLVERTTRSTPDRIALVDGRETLTYAELNARANQLARRLGDMGVGRESAVGVFVERSATMLVAILGVLKAGAAYVPLDPVHPRERLALLASDAKLAAVLTVDALAPRLPASSTPVLSIDASWSAITVRARDDLGLAFDADQMAYLIYTSGSTGRPKGVQVPHRTAAAYVRTAVESYRAAPHDRFLQFASISFDASIEEIFPALAVGATLVLRSDEMLTSPARFLERCGELGITVLNLPTAYWHELTHAMASGAPPLPASIRVVIIGGERALPQRLAAWREHVPERVRLVNTYGPTEATVVATACDLTGAAAVPVLGDVPIGTGVHGVDAYVLDRHLEPTPRGAPGELFLGGLGVVRGYLGAPDATAERFVPDPFSPSPGSRMYRTGDRARARRDRQLEFLGRVDDQVKIRGFRIELGEIEHALSRVPEVREAVVIAREDEPGDRRIAAYVVPAIEGAVLPSGPLRTALARSLPEYMIPSAFVTLTHLPLNANGKVDRGALPVPTAAGSEPETDARPGSPVEQTLALIVGEVLHVPRVGLDQSFFDLGGHSLLATKVVARAEEALGITLELRTLFERPTVQAIAELLATRPDAEVLRQRAELYLEVMGLSDEEIEESLDSTTHRSTPVDAAG